MALIFDFKVKIVFDSFPLCIKTNTYEKFEGNRLSNCGEVLNIKRTDEPVELKIAFFGDLDQTDMYNMTYLSSMCKYSLLFIIMHLWGNNSHNYIIYRWQFPFTIFMMITFFSLSSF